MRNYFFPILVVVTLFCCASNSNGQIINTIAGSGTLGFGGDGGPSTAAVIGSIDHIATDINGNLYLADGNRIRKITPAGTITTIAGTGTSGFSGDGGPATAAQISTPWGIAADHHGNIFFGDISNSRIRKIDASGNISTIAGNGTIFYVADGVPATSAAMSVLGVAVDTSGNVYFCDPTNSRIRMVNTAGIISTIAGNGTSGYSGDGAAATAAEVYQPHDIFVHKSGNIVFSDFNNFRIRQISPAGIITSIAGTGIYGYSGDLGPATAAEINYLFGIATDTAGNIYIADTDNQRIRKIDTSGVIKTICGVGTPGFSGDGGPATAAQLDDPQSVAVDNAGIVFIADFLNYRIRKFSPVVSTTTATKMLVNNQGISVYPNPVINGKFSLNLTSVTDEQVLITITNQAGEQLLNLNSITNKPISIQLNVPAGIYNLEAQSDQQVWQKRIIVLSN